MAKLQRLISVFVLLGTVAGANADTTTFHFAQVGQSYSAFLSSANPLVGQHVTHARFYLDVLSNANSDAAAFFTDISFPIDPLPGNTNFFSLLGADENWSGPGTFHYFLDTTDYNGTFVPARYGAETFGDGFHGAILDTSRIEFDYVPEPSALALLALLGVAGVRRR